MEKIVMPNKAQAGDVLVLTKPLGIRKVGILFRKNLSCFDLSFYFISVQL